MDVPSISMQDVEYLRNRDAVLSVFERYERQRQIDVQALGQQRAQIEALQGELRDTKAELATLAEKPARNGSRAKTAPKAS